MAGHEAIRLRTSFHAGVPRPHGRWKARFKISILALCRHVYACMHTLHGSTPVVQGASGTDYIGSTEHDARIR